MARVAGLTVLLALISTAKVCSACYFPVEYQGEFLTQSMSSLEIAYHRVSIFSDSIPGWGRCHRRLGRHVILKDEESANGAGNNDSSCYKCLSIVSRSPNVLQLHTMQGLERCYPTEQQAVQSCPGAQSVRERRAKELMLYKTKNHRYDRGPDITKTYCPLNGHFKFTYSINDGTEDDLECDEPVSQATDCSTGYMLELDFKGCSFPDFGMSFQCLGSWPGENGETYLSLLDMKLPQVGEEPRPRYRCALFKEDPDTGLTHVALSSDSTCVNHLYSAQDGYETLHLEKLPPPPPASGPSVASTAPKCIFPDWMQGQWEGLDVRGGELVWRDKEKFVTYRGRCLRGVAADRFAVLLETECGQSRETCALFQQRDANVMEFQLGVSSHEPSSDPGSSPHLLDLCSVSNFSPSNWLTLGRSHIEDPPHCPLVGEYTGVLPDAEGICAKSYADCNNPEVMFYTVFNCSNHNEVFEEREYRCFGQWQENGLVYTYTERVDLPGNECFVGVTIDDDRNIVSEAGAHCERGHQPEKTGMTLHRQAKCSAPTVSNADRRNPGHRGAAAKDVLNSNRAVSPRLRPAQNRDTFTNEIPGSYSSKSAAGLSSSLRGCSPLMLLCALVCSVLCART